jgi:hypothetical protein
MKLARISERTRRLLQVTGLDAVFEIYNTSDEAMMSFSKTERIGEYKGFGAEHRERACA